MNSPSLYLVRNLYLPSGEVLERIVVRVENDNVLEWYPFESESQSMLLVDDLHLFYGSDGVLMIDGVVSF